MQTGLESPYLVYLEDMYISRRKRIGFKLKFTRENMFRYAVAGVVGAVAFGTVFAFGLFAWYAKDLPEPGKLSQISENATVFYDRDGKVLFEMYKDKNRLPVAMKDISDHLKNAPISIEDKAFYKHGGISQTGPIRAFDNMLLKEASREAARP
jgi:membrane peptidoglycan carboxypeptidase